MVPDADELLMRLGRHAEAAEELERAAELVPIRHERAMLMERAAAASATWPLRA
ncbi:hypothetical protein [Allorhizocola rhizosphaerae]|uniref:hypothetical protein n=1 Tax=Allorhizocola rhizosphaerae TaxID=1872709 RepID=UPI001B8CFEBF|nr:hypothetical protein [Allorhizocola rhizosphaerae]